MRAKCAPNQEVVALNFNWKQRACVKTASGENYYKFSHTHARLTVTLIYYYTNTHSHVRLCLVDCGGVVRLVQQILQDCWGRGTAVAPPLAVSKLTRARARYLFYNTQVCALLNTLQNCSHFEWASFIRCMCAAVQYLKKKHTHIIK